MFIPNLHKHNRLVWFSRFLAATASKIILYAIWLVVYAQIPGMESRDGRLFILLVLVTELFYSLFKKYSSSWSQRENLLNCLGWVFYRPDKDRQCLLTNFLY